MTRKLPPLTAVVAFEAAARRESFLAASAELSLTPSAISHQVRNLELWLDRKLFVRGTRSLSLTREGRRLLEDVAPALDAIGAACATLRPAPGHAQLRVHCTPSFATKWLAPRLGNFLKAHPGVTIRLSSSAEPVNLMRDTGIEVHIAYGDPPAARGVTVEPLGRERTTPLCSPRLLPPGRPVTGQELLGMVLIESQVNPVGWADWCRANGLRPPHGEGLSFDRGALAVAAAVDGMGVALETQRFAEAELARGDLVAIEGPGMEAIVRPMHHLCYRSALAASPELALFSAWLKAELAG
jgi:DNA-binding transcriptional LysR family regulator